MTVTRPRLLDLFCGAGGAAMGYHRAGFDVVGVDINPQPRYPFQFVRADAEDVLAGLNVNALAEIGRVDAIRASPPCQDYSRAMRCFVQPGQYPRLIEPIREHLLLSGRPWVIENVPGAPLPTQTDLFGAYGVELCGTMFDLRIWRHRLFETSFPITPPRGCDHALAPMNPHKAPTRKKWRALLDGEPVETAWRAEMGVPWMNQAEGREAVPPSYTEHIGLRLLTQMEAAA